MTVDGAALGAAGRTEQQCDVTLVAHDVGGTGGMERQLAELALGLRELGHDVSVIARTCDLPASSGVSFHRVRTPRRPFLLSYPSFMLAGSLAVRRRRRGVVQTAGAIVLGHVDAITVHCCHRVYNSVPPDRSKFVRAYFRLVGLVKRAGEGWCFKANDKATLVCVSNGVADEVRQHYPEVRGRVVTIHNGVDLKAFSPAKREPDGEAVRASLGVSRERLLAVFVGGNWEHKGLRLVLEALAKAREWDLVVAGRGDQRHYQQLARSLGVATAVHWLGLVKDVQPVYASADAFVLPTRYETFSLVTFEAAASGLPVLVTPVSGVGELIEDGRNGYLIDPDADTIAGRLRELGADPALRARLGEAVRRSALQFGWERMVAKHERLFTRLGS